MKMINKEEELLNLEVKNKKIIIKLIVIKRKDNY